MVKDADRLAALASPDAPAGGPARRIREIHLSWEGLDGQYVEWPMLPPEFRMFYARMALAAITAEHADTARTDR